MSKISRADQFLDDAVLAGGDIDDAIAAAAHHHREFGRALAAIHRARTGQRTAHGELRLLRVEFTRVKRHAPFLEAA